MKDHEFECPGSKMRQFGEPAADTAEKDETGSRPTELRHWPVQLHLISPLAPYYKSADVLLAADCTAYTAGDFHKDFLKGKSLAIACPKLDDGQEIYVEKRKALMDEAQINTLTVAIMEVPCCMGLLHLAKQALEQAARKVPVKALVLSIRGEVLSEEWV